MLRSRNGLQLRRGNWLWLILIFFLAVALPLLLYLQERDDGGGAPRGESGPPSSWSHSCPGVNVEGAEEWRKTVLPVYRAACERDYTRLSRLLGGGSVKNFTTDECSGCGAADILYMWRTEYAFDGGSLARVLQSRPQVDQGGLTYDNGEALAIFSRGTHDVPSQWTDFFPECRSDSRCTQIAPLYGQLP